MNKSRMRALSLFSGIGGFELAATALNCFTVQQLVEIDEDAHHGLPHKIDIKRTRLTSRTLKTYFLSLRRESALAGEAAAFATVQIVIKKLGRNPVQKGRLCVIPIS